MRIAGVLRSSCWPDFMDQINAMTNPMDILKLNPIMMYNIAIYRLFLVSQISTFESTENMIIVMLSN